MRSFRMYELLCGFCVYYYLATRKIMFTLANVMRITNKIQEEKNVSHIGRVCVCVSVQRETMKTLKL